MRKGGIVVELFSLFATIGLKDSEFTKGIGKSKSAFGKLGGVASTAVKGIIAGVAAAGTALIGMGTAAVNMGMKFEAQMSIVKSIAGASADEMVRLADKAKYMGATTQFTAVEAGQALEFMAQAGWKTNEMLDGLEGVMYAAGSSGESLASVANIVADGLTAFGLAADQSSRFADVLARASADTNTSIAMLGESFTYAAPVAGALKFAIEDTATALGLMANAGIKGSVAGTSLRAMLSNLANPTKKQAAALGELGISLTDNEGNMKSLNSIMEDFRESMAGMAPDQQAFYAATIAGDRAMAGLLAIVNTAPDKFDELSASIANSTGAAKEMNEIRLDNLKGDITILKSAVEGLGIQFYESVNSPLREIAKTGIEMIGELSDAFSEGGLSGMVGKLGSVFSRVITDIAGAAPKIIDAALALVSSFITGIQDNLPEILESGMGMLESLIMGISQMLPQLAKAAVDIIVGLATSLSKSLPELIPTAVEAILTLITGLIDNLPMILDAALQLIQGLAEGLIKALPIFIKALPKIITGLVDFLLKSIPMIIDAAITLFTSLVDALPEIIDAIVEALPELISGIVTGLLSNIPAIIDAGIKLFTALFTATPQIISEIVKKLPEIIDGIIKGFSDGFKDVNLLDSGKEIINGLFDGIKTAFSEAWASIEALFTSIIDSVKSIFGIQSPSKVFGEIAENIILGLVNVLETLPQAVWDAIVDAIDKVAKWGSDMVSKGRAAATNVINRISGVLSGLPDKVWNAIKAAISKMIQWGKDMVANGKKAADDTVAKVKDIFSTLPGKLVKIGEDLVKGLWNGIKNVTQWVLDKIKGFGNDILNGIKNIFGIKSPSTKTRRIGAFLGEGLGEGIMSSLGGVLGVIDVFSGRVLDAFSGIGGDGLFDGILPDLSDINARLNATGSTAGMQPAFAGVGTSYGDTNIYLQTVAQSPYEVRRGVMDGMEQARRMRRRGR